MVGDGIPDVLALRKGIVTFLELKCIAAMPKRETTPVLGDEGLNVEQRNWHLAWTKAGGRSVILIGVKDSGLHWAVWGIHADIVNQLSANELRHWAFASGTRHGDGFWTRLYSQL